MTQRKHDLTFCLAPTALALLCSCSLAEPPRVAAPSEEIRTSSIISDPEVGGEAEMVDLSGEKLASIEQADNSEVLAEPWYRRFDISGFAATGYIDGGDDSKREIGAFQVKEASLFLEAEPWENIFFFLEFQTNRLGYDSFDPRTAEIHLHFRNVLRKYGDDLLGVKVGRFDIPFGEEYLWQDSSDNPLISLSAAYPYGWDEGVLLYGSYRGLSWIAAVSDGTDLRSKDDHSAKAVNAKISGEPLSWLYLSASAMRNGSAGKSAFEFGGSHFEPVGSSGPSALGASPSSFVKGSLFEIDGKATFGGPAARGYVSFAYGEAKSDDEMDAFDRDIRWFMVEPFVQITNRLYGVARYSEIGTYDDTRGFHFDGKPFAGGNRAFGFDTERLTRLSLGLGYKPTPTMTFKVEIGRDRFALIETSTLSSTDDDRDLIGVELVLAF